MIPVAVFKIESHLYEGGGGFGKRIVWLLGVILQRRGSLGDVKMVDIEMLKEDECLHLTDPGI